MKKVIGKLYPRWTEPPFITPQGFVVVGNFNNNARFYLPTFQGSIIFISQKDDTFNLNRLRAQVKLLKTTEKPIVVIDIVTKGKPLRTITTGRTEAETFLRLECAPGTYHYHRVRLEDITTEELVQMMTSIFKVGQYNVAKEFEKMVL